MGGQEKRISGEGEESRKAGKFATLQSIADSQNALLHTVFNRYSHTECLLSHLLSKFECIMWDFLVLTNSNPAASC